MMTISQKILSFLVGFSALFYFVRTNDIYNSRILIADLGGIPWLYAAIGSIFSVIAAFVIQKEWDIWNNLADAVKNEVDALTEILLWTAHHDPAAAHDIKSSVCEYLHVVIREGWTSVERGDRSEAAEQALASLYRVIIKSKDPQPDIAARTFSLFADLIKYRRDRLHFSTRRMPEILRGTLIFAMSLMIGLSLLIGIKNIWLAYLFTTSIATLVYIIYTVIMDMDRPLLPGGWHLTTKDYRDLLARIRPENIRA